MNDVSITDSDKAMGGRQTASDSNAPYPATPPPEEILRGLADMAVDISHTDDGWIRLTLVIPPELLDHWSAASTRDLEQQAYTL